MPPACHEELTEWRQFRFKTIDGGLQCLDPFVRNLKLRFALLFESRVRKLAPTENRSF